MAEYIVTARAIGYLDADGNEHGARRSESVDLTGKEAERLTALNAVAKAGSDEAKAAEADPAPGLLRSEQAGAPGHPETLEEQGLAETGGITRATRADGTEIQPGETLDGSDTDGEPAGDWSGVTVDRMDEFADDNDVADYKKSSKATRALALEAAGYTPEDVPE